MEPDYDAEYERLKRERKAEIVLNRAEPEESAPPDRPTHFTPPRPRRRNQGGRRHERPHQNIVTPRSKKNG